MIYYFFLIDFFLIEISFCERSVFFFFLVPKIVLGLVATGEDQVG